MCVDTAKENAAKNLAPRRHILPPIWERGLAPSIFRPVKNREALGTRMRMAPPPPLVAKRQLPMTVVPPIMTARSGTDKKRRIRWPKEPASVEEEKAVEIKTWKNIIDAIGPEHCRIADQLNTATWPRRATTERPRPSGSTREPSTCL